MIIILNYSLHTHCDVIVRGGGGGGGCGGGGGGGGGGYYGWRVSFLQQINRLDWCYFGKSRFHSTLKEIP